MNITAFIASMIGIGKVLWAFIAPLLVEHTAAILVALLPVAHDVVQTLWSSDKTGAEKRAEAAKQVELIAKAEGIRATDSLINTAVELALQRLKAEEAKAQPIPSK